MFLYKIKITVTEMMSDDHDEEQPMYILNHTDLVSAPTPNRAIKKIVLPKIEAYQILNVNITLSTETTTTP